MRLARFALLLSLLTPISASAQPAAVPPAPPTASTANPPGILMQYTLPPDKLEKSHALYVQDTRLLILDTIYGFAVLLALLYFGTVATFRSLAEGATSRKWLQGFIVVPLFFVTLSVLSIPSDVYHQYLAHQYGLSVQGWGSWFGDWVKTLLLGAALGSALLSLLYWMIRLSPKRWWFYGWLLCVPVVILILFIVPLVVEPLFYTFTPLEQTNPELVTQIERVTQRGGLEIPRSRMFLMNASSKLTGDNAYVSGFGASKRVVVWDTTSKHMTTAQVMFVFGHEMGHYVLGHIPKLIGFTLAVLLLFLYLSYRLSGWMVRRWGTKWHISGIADWASVPMLILLISFFSFVFDPAFNGFSRYVEHQADTYGLEVTHGLYPNSGVVAAQAFQILGENWLEYPYESDFYEWWSQGHPLVRKRVIYAQEYDPWGQGKEPEFVKGTVTK